MIISDFNFAIIPEKKGCCTMEGRRRKKPEENVSVLLQKQLNIIVGVSS